MSTERWAKRWDQYRETSFGPNLWTEEALHNVATLSDFFERARFAINGRFTSVYRSVDVNFKAKGSPRSDHLRGLACDIVPKLMSVEAAARKIYAAAQLGDFGPVHQIIIEPSWVHVGWRPVMTIQKEVRLHRYEQGKYPMLEAAKIG